MDMQSPIWERQEFDTNKSFQAFCIYRDMGDIRSIRRAADKLQKSYVLIGEWSTKHNWQERVFAYDEWRAGKASEAVTNYEQVLIASDFESLMAVNREILNRLEENPSQYSPNQLLKMSVKLYKQYRQKTETFKNEKTEQWHKLRFSILERDGFQCQYCGQSPLKHGVSLHIDHITPRAKGGGNEPSNLITSCSICNLGKSDVLLEQRLEQQLRYHSNGKRK